MLDVHRLRLLREVAYRGTIAAAAQALAYTPSAVSQQLAVLEREAGLPLLVRTGRRVELTPAARALVARAEDIFARLEEAEAGLAAARADLAGTLRLGVFPSAARTIVPAALARLGREHPRLELRVEEMDPVVAAEAVRAGELDVALTHDYDLVPTVDHPALESTVILAEPMVLASRCPATGVETFRDHFWILGKPGTLCRLAGERVCQAAGFQPRVRHQIDDYPTVLALVAADQGVSVMPRLGTIGAPAGVVFTPLPALARVAVTHRRGASAQPAISAFQEVALRAVKDLVAPVSASLHG